MIGRLFFAAAIAAAGIGTSASAQTPAVDQALAAGVVGERYDGYLGFAATGSAALRSEVATINIRRRSLYSALAARKGAAPQDVALTAGCQLLERVRVGQAYMLSDGVWRHRVAGQRPPVPDYCG